MARREIIWDLVTVLETLSFGGPSEPGILRELK
jgi:hypothetical protein